MERAGKTATEVLQIRIELLGVEPSIWRRILIAASSTFWDLHVAIQDAMGWQDSHLHLFRVDDPATGQERLIGLHTEEDDLEIEPGWEHRVADLLSSRRPRAVYEYDFGDSWEHAVVLEDVLPADGRGPYPRCLSGARACPPEDVGGTYGYEEFLAAIADPDHEEHDAFLQWVGGAFDPERFEAKGVRFQDPDARWQEVFGGDSQAVGPQAVRRIHLEGGFAPADVQRLLLSPFAADSPLQLATDLPEAAFGEAPLVRDTFRFLRLLAEVAPLKLTQRGNLPRTAIARLVQAEALGSPWWWQYRAPSREGDAPRATLLRQLAELAGLTRKRHGKLELTKRGRGVVEGRTGVGAVWRLLLEQHATRYRWSYADRMPESRWLQTWFWYVLFLLQEYGAEKRSTTFYGQKLVEAFPYVLDDFPPTRYSDALSSLVRALEVRVLLRFALEFGLACATEGAQDPLRERMEVWAGPLLHPGVRWRREEAGADGTGGKVVEGPWQGTGDQGEHDGAGA